MGFYLVVSFYFSTNNFISYCNTNDYITSVVVNTTKVRFFKQITTEGLTLCQYLELLLIPQRYDFSSKSQQATDDAFSKRVVVNTTKVRFFKQITTPFEVLQVSNMLLLIPQRYDFSSKSQLQWEYVLFYEGCC